MIHKICHLYMHTQADREDLFQEIIIQTWRSYPKFRGDSKFSTWLYRIALNTAISDLRKQKKQVTSFDPQAMPFSISDMQYDTHIEDQLQRMYNAIGKLTEVEKAIVMLYLDDKSYEEMEDILGISQNNLRVKMNRIKDKLRKITQAVEYGIG